MASRSGGGRAWSPGGADGDQAGEGGERAVTERELEEAQRARELAGDEVGDRRSAVGDEVDGRQQPGALCGDGAGEQGAHAAGEGDALRGAGDGAGEDEEH